MTTVLNTHHDQPYLDLLRHVRDNGVIKSDRTGTGTKSVFGYQMRFDLQQGFPLLTTKKLHLKSIIHELLWFLAGDTNVKYLQENGVKIWDEWADEKGNLGPIYGYQWRSWPGKLLEQGIGDSDSDKWDDPYTDGDGKYWPYYDSCVKQEGIDQISNLLKQLRTNPDSRRLIVSAWNPAQVDQMKLPPCHCLFQFYTRELTLKERIAYQNEVIRKEADAFYESEESRFELRNYQQVETSLPKDDAEAHEVLTKHHNVPTRALSCQLYQRSCDTFLGVPFNIASYALLTHMIAQQVNMAVGDFVWTGGDVHLYQNHVEQVDLQLNRHTAPSPTLRLRKANSLFDYKFEDFDFLDYDPQPNIPAKVAV